MSPVPVEDFVDLALAQTGDDYVFGHEVSLSDPDPDVFDCSELVQWACARLNVSPVMPDGSWFQFRHCYNRGLAVSISEGISTRGALLFRFRGGDPLTGARPTSSHVAVSLGDGTTIEARGSAWGVGSWSTVNRDWTHAALIPGLDYIGDDDMPDPRFSDEVADFLNDMYTATSDVDSNGWFPKAMIPWFRANKNLPDRVAVLEAGDNPTGNALTFGTAVILTNPEGQSQ